MVLHLLLQNHQGFLSECFSTITYWDPDPHQVLREALRYRIRVLPVPMMPKRPLCSLAGLLLFVGALLLVNHIGAIKKTESSQKQREIVVYCTCTRYFSLWVLIDLQRAA